MDSANIVYWVDVPSSTFLPANTGTAPTNTIYLGWAANSVAIPEDTAWRTTTGEAPQLSCANPSNTVACSGYGQYDNGNQVFSFYDGFAGNTLSSLWTPTGNVIVSNGVNITESASPSGIASVSAFSNYPYWLEMLAVGKPTGNPGVPFAVEESLTNLIISTTALGYKSGYGLGYTTSSPPTTVATLIANALGTITRTTLISTSPNPPIVGGVAWTATGSQRYENQYATYSGSNSLMSIGPQYFDIYYVGSVATFWGFAQWARARVYPPNGIMPATTLGAVTSYTAPSTPSQPSASNPIANTSQYETFSTSFTGGTSPYTYNWIISNSVTGAVVYTSSASNSLTANTITVPVSAYFTANSPLVANIVVSDWLTTVSSAYSSNFIAYVQPPSRIPFTGGMTAASTSIPTTTVAPTSTVTPTTTIPLITFMINSTLSLAPGGSNEINVANTGTSVTLTSPSGGSAHVTVSNTMTSAAPPQSYSLVSAINISARSSSNLTVYLSMKYPCSAPANAMAPYRIVSGSWTAISGFTVNASACTVSFYVPAAPTTVGLFEETKFLSSAPPTTIQPITSSSVPTTTVPQGAQSSGSGYALPLAIAAVVIIIVGGSTYYVARRRRKA
jgi:hypothetical protein